MSLNTHRERNNRRPMQRMDILQQMRSKYNYIFRAYSKVTLPSRTSHNKEALHRPAYLERQFLAEQIYSSRKQSRIPHLHERKIESAVYKSKNPSFYQTNPALLPESTADNLYLSEGKRKNIVQRSREQTYKRCLSATDTKAKVKLDPSLQKLSTSKGQREEVERVQSERWFERKLGSVSACPQRGQRQGKIIVFDKGIILRSNI